MADFDIDKIVSGIKIDGANPYSEAEAESWADIPFWISTGCVSLDYAIGGFKRGYRGGIPASRAVEINGLESTAKSAMLSHIIRSTCNGGGAFFLCDAEHATPDERLLTIGVNLKNFRRIEKSKEMVEAEEALEAINEEWDEAHADEQPDEEGPQKRGKKKKGTKKKRAKASSKHFDVTLEEFFDVAEATLVNFRKAVPDPKVPVVFGLDSLAVIETAAQAATDDPNMKDKVDTAVVMAARFKGFCQSFARLNGTLVIVNQLRTKIGTSFGDPLYSYGGDAKNYLFSLRVRMYKAEKIHAKDEVLDVTRELLPDDVVGIQGNGMIVKNKVADPFRKFRFPLYFDSRGILHEQCLAQMIIDREKWLFSDDFEKKSKNGRGEGNTFYWKGEELGTNEKGLTQAFIKDPMLRDEVEEELFG